MRRAQRLASLPPDLAGQLAGVKAQALADGRDVIDLASDVLDTVPLAPAGRPEDVAAWFADRFGVSLDAESEITVVPGSKSGLAHTLWAVVDPGDVVLTPGLVAPWVRASVLLAGGVPQDVPLRAENGWLPDLAAIPGNSVQTAKVLFLNFPHDPTGAVATKEFFQSAVNFARETGILILNDASHAHLGCDGYRAPSILECNGALEVALEMHRSFLAGSADALRALRRVQAIVGNDGFTATTGSTASNEALTRRRDVLVDGLNGLGWHVGKPQATPFVWAPVPPGYTSAECAQTLLERADVLTLPGPAFGPQGEGYLRLSLGEREERMAEAVRRIKQAL